MTLVDTNVLLDLVTDDPPAGRTGRWRNSKPQALPVRCRSTTPSMPRAALFLAGKVFTRYRRAGGTRTGVLPDVFIGAHTAVADLPLLTRDLGRYRRYFPTVRLIAPD